MAKVQLDRGLSMRKIITLSLLAAALAVSGCNTVAGIGRDVEAVGTVVSDAARPD
jgi:predicted small secreted protein